MSRRSKKVIKAEEVCKLYVLLRSQPMLYIAVMVVLIVKSLLIWWPWQVGKCFGHKVTKFHRNQLVFSG